MAKYKVLYTTNIPVPYKVNFFNLLSESVDLTVTFEREEASDRDSSWLKSVPCNFNKIVLSGIPVGADSAISKQIIDVVKKGNFDKIVVGVYNTPTAMLLIHYLKSHRIPYMLSSDGGFISDGEPRIKYRIKNYFMSGADAYFSPGKETNKYLEWYGASKERIIEYPFTSISEPDIVKGPISDSQKMSLKKELELPTGHVVLSIGQFIPRKGMDTLIKAGKLMNSDTFICIIGGKPSKEYLKLVDDSAEAKIVFKSFMSKEELAKYYKAADVFALATREDIWGLVVNEAMSYGLPVVTTTACMAGLEMVKDGENGFLVSPDDPQGLAQRINDVLYSNKYLEMQQECLKTARRYTLENMANAYIDKLK